MARLREARLSPKMRTRSCKLSINNFLNLRGMIICAISIILFHTFLVRNIITGSVTVNCGGPSSISGRLDAAETSFRGGRSLTADLGGATDRVLDKALSGCPDTGREVIADRGLSELGCCVRIVKLLLRESEAVRVDCISSSVVKAATSSLL
jgi:hypothetical protein